MHIVWRVEHANPPPGGFMNRDSVAGETDRGGMSGSGLVEAAGVDVDEDALAEVDAALSALADDW